MSTALAENKVHEATGGYLFRTIKGKTKYLHVDAAEKALGHALPVGAEVHHINGDTKDNSNKNLVICQDHKYHSLLHMRQEALLVTGNPNLRLCCICGIFDEPSRMNPKRHQLYHPKCLAFQSKMRRRRIKMEKETSK